MFPKSKQCKNSLSLLESNIDRDYSLTQRIEAETFIRESFADFYGADIHQFMPILLSLQDSSCQIKAALGLRPAIGHSLFLEKYLDNPVERVLSQKFRKLINRENIIEVGNLAIGDKGYGRTLIIAMSAFLYARNFQYVVFTIGPMLKNSFSRLGLPLIDLGAASIDKLNADERTSWGKYYDQGPRVMAGRLDDAHHFISRYSLQEADSLQSLWTQAQSIGRQAA